MTALASDIGELGSVERLSSVLDAFEARLQTLPLASTETLSILDRIAQPDGLPRQAASLAAFVSCEATDNTDSLRDDVAALVDDAVVVSLFYRVNPKDQKASRRRAMDLEEDVRALLTAYGWRSEWHVNYRGAKRGPHPESAEHWVSQQTFRLRRYARLGG